MVTGQRYRYVWFDGLNRYYIAEEHPELATAFSAPPNVFDEFVTYHLQEAWDAHKSVVKSLRESESRAAAAQIEMHDAMQRAQYLEEQIDDAFARAELAENETGVLRDELAALHLANHQTSVWARGLEEKLVGMQTSRSWRVTKPLRAVARVYRVLRAPGLARRVATRITANERLRRAIIPFLLRYPALGKRVSSSLQAIKQAVPGPAPAGAAVPEEMRALPASVRIVLADLHQARSKHTGS
jgi:hypothetical protein